MGFWSTLAGVGKAAVGFIPGIGPIASAAIGAGLGALGGGLLGGGGNKANGGMSQLSVDAGKAYESPAVQSGLDTLQAPKNYFKAALGGSQEQLQGLLGPEVSTVLSQYDNAAKTAAELGPKGGGRTAVLAEAPFKKAAAYGQALSGARSGAAKELADIGGKEASLGSQQEQIRNQFKLEQASINTQQNRSQLDAQRMRQQAFSDLGSGIGGILTRIIANKKSGGGTGGNVGSKGGIGTPPFFPNGLKTSSSSNLSVKDQYGLGF